MILKSTVMTLVLLIQINTENQIRNINSESLGLKGVTDLSDTVSGTGSRVLSIREDRDRLTGLGCPAGNRSSTRYCLLKVLGLNINPSKPSKLHP